MKKLFFIVSALFFYMLTGCSNQSAETRQTLETAAVTCADAVDSMVKKVAVEKKIVPHVVKPKAFEKFAVAFWDSFVIKQSPSKNIRFDLNQKKSASAYRLGIFYASGDHRGGEILQKLLPETADTVSFQTCLLEMENNKMSGMAAVMLAGYYFETLSFIVGGVNEETHLPDERVLAEGISRLDSLKSYCNDALISEPDINITLPVQRIIALTDTLKNAYSESLTLLGGDKYDKLSKKIQETESVIFEETK